MIQLGQWGDVGNLIPKQHYTCTQFQRGRVLCLEYAGLYFFNIGNVKFVHQLYIEMEANERKCIEMKMNMKCIGWISGQLLHWQLALALFISIIM